MGTDTLTDFLREPKKVLRRLEKEDLVLSRRGKTAIRMSLESRQEAAVDRNEIASHLLADAVERMPEIRAGLPGILESRFPWVRFLPPGEQEKFGIELVKTIQACAAVGNLARIEEVFRSWKATAEVYADPKLAEKLKGPFAETEAHVRRP